MPFKKGEPRPEGAGRKKGTPHKKSLLVKEVLDNHGINLAEQIVVRLPKLSSLEQVRALVALLPYVYPKLTNVMVDADIKVNSWLDKPREELRQKAIEILKADNAIK